MIANPPRGKTLENITTVLQRFHESRKTVEDYHLLLYQMKYYYPVVRAIDGKELPVTTEEFTECLKKAGVQGE